MRIARIATVVVMVLVCACAQAAPQAQTKMTVTGTLARAMAIVENPLAGRFKSIRRLPSTESRCIRSRLVIRTRRSWKG